MEKVQITIDRVGEDHGYPGVDVDWTREPVFEFGTEMAALVTLQDLGGQLEAARKQVRHVMRYMAAAVVAARDNGEGETTKEAIIGNSGLARRTVYTILERNTADAAPAPLASSS